MSKAGRQLRAERNRGSPSKRATVLVIRDSFTMPAADYELINTLKKRCLRLGIAIKKSELLRAGLATLQRLSDPGLAQVVAAVENVKTGRPAGAGKKAKSMRTKASKR